jgi:hypothetical protein
VTKKELNELAHGMAFERAVSVIETACVEVEDSWFDTREEALEPYEIDGIQEAVGYLDARGLIVRHPEKAGWIQMLDESEATR